MKAYKITATQDDEVLARRLAGTQALAKDARDELMDKFGLPKKNVVIEDEEVPMDKPSLLEYLNTLLEEQDAVEDDTK